MEAIAIVIGQLILAPFLACVAVVAEFVLACILAIGKLLASLLGNKKREAQGTAETAAIESSQRLEQVKRWSIVGVWSSFGVMFSILVIADLFFVDRLLAFGLEKVHQKSGIQIAYQSMSGHFLTGGFTFEEMRLTRDELQSSSFDLTIDELELGVNPLALAWPTPKIHQIRVDGLKGRFVRHAPNQGKNPRKNFRIEDLIVREVALDIEDHTRAEPVRFSLAVPEFHTRSLVGDYLLFAVLFR